MATAALNFSDLLMIRGTYQVCPDLPFVAGQEIAGTVVAAGPGSDFEIGDRIASKVIWGGFADAVAVPDNMMIRLPDAMPFDQAAALPVVYTTALIALRHRAKLTKGETVLVHAGASGVGLAAVQIARAFGARVFATAGSPEKIQIACDNGAEAAFDYGSTDWVSAVRERTGNAGVDVVFDPVGGDVTASSLRCIAWGGRLLVVGFASGTIPGIPAGRLLIKSASALGVYWTHERDGALVDAATAELLRLWETREIRPVVGARYGFDQVPKALADMDRRRVSGKAIIVVDPSA